MPDRISSWALYDVFTVKEGEQIFLAAVSDAQWVTFCDAMGYADLKANPQLATNNDRVRASHADAGGHRRILFRVRRNGNACLRCRAGNQHHDADNANPSSQGWLHGDLPRRRRQFLFTQKPVAVHVLAAEALGQLGQVRFAGDRLAAPARQLIRRQGAIAVAIHALEGVAHPGLVFGQADTTIAVTVHPRQIVAGGGDLGPHVIAADHRRQNRFDTALVAVFHFVGVFQLRRIQIAAGAVSVRLQYPDHCPHSAGRRDYR